MVLMEYIDAPRLQQVKYLGAKSAAAAGAEEETTKSPLEGGGEEEGTNSPDNVSRSGAATSTPSKPFTPPS